MKTSIFRVITEIFSLLTPDQRKKFYKLQAMVVLMVFAEISGIVAFVPFMALIGDVNILQGSGKLAELYELSGIKDPYEFVFWVGVVVIGVLAVGALISAMTVWNMSLYSAKVGMEIGEQLYEYYMHQPWLFHSSSNSSQLTKQVAQEAGRVSNQIISPLLQMNAKLLLIIFLTTAICLYNPFIAISGIIVLAIAYFVLYKSVKSKLDSNGETLSQGTAERYRLMAEGFGGIKDTLLLGRQTFYTNRFKVLGNKLAYCLGANRSIAQIPRYIMELIALGSIIFLVLYLIKTYDGNLGEILPVLAVYALAGYKLLPAAQQVYSSVATIKGGMAAFDSIKADLRSGQASHQEAERSSIHPTNNRNMPFKNNITLENICFTYPGKEYATLKQINMVIPINKVIGLVGASGSGKSTTVDLLLGLIQPQEGRILIDDVPLQKDNKRDWQNTIGFVPQDIFLSDRSIAENIALGFSREDIDVEQVTRSIKLAHLDELIDQFPDGLDTRIGENGVQLSGGQRQRIGIARSLYHDAEVLIFDEATSALDGITEKLIMDAIHDFSGNKTIVMIAHRLQTVKKCDIIFLFDKGNIIDQGTYGELKERNDRFRTMTMHA